MRIFDLFLRRAGVDRPPLPGGQSSSSRLTVTCPRDALATLRRQICLDFAAAGLDVSQVQIDKAEDPQLATACITVKYPSNKREALMSQARLLHSHPDVRHVHFGRFRRAAA
jgi:hypothetical protein